MWDGPFRTAEFETLARAEAAASLAALAGIVVGIVMLVRKRDERALFLPIAFVALAGLAAWMVERTVPLFGMTGAVLAVTLAWRLRAHAVTSLVLAAAIGWHGWDQVRTLADPQWRIAWYLPPPSADENVEMLAWVRANVPAGEPVASDFVTSAAILAFTRRPILNQPKYETRRSRELIEQMSNALYRATPSELATFLRERRCRWLVLNRPLFGATAAHIGGLRPEELARMGDKASMQMMANEPARFAHVAGFTLVYASRPELGFASYRVYRVD